MPATHTFAPRLWTGRAAPLPGESAALASAALARTGGSGHSSGHSSGHPLRPRTLIIPEGGSLALECKGGRRLALALARTPASALAQAVSLALALALALALTRALTLTLALSLTTDH